MDFQELDINALRTAPPYMRWQSFADWIGFGDQPQIVRGWMDRDYVPTVRIGKHLLINVELIRKQLMEND